MLRKASSSGNCFPHCLFIPHSRLIQTIDKAARESYPINNTRVLTYISHQYAVQRHTGKFLTFALIDPLAVFIG